jgi:hypothetical protein
MNEKFCLSSSLFRSSFNAYLPSFITNCCRIVHHPIKFHFEDEYALQYKLNENLDISNKFMMNKYFLALL